VIDWTKGYRAALDDTERLLHVRGLLSPDIATLIGDLRQDAHVIEHEEHNRALKRRLAAAREAVEASRMPLFAEGSHD
jgi:hypothetical protein